MKKRILFVDDEANILDGLRRMLRPQRLEWDMNFAASGQDALSALSEQHYDAVVSDMRMPGMDGAELLAQVQHQYPHIVRIILSGQSDQEAILRSVAPSHRYLAKPCDAQLIKSVLVQSFALRDLLNRDELRSVVAGMDHLPTLPSLYEKLVEMLQSEQTSVHDVGELVASDPVMASEILRLVNSAYFGIGRRITNPSQATTYLGLETIRDLVLAVGLFTQLDAGSTKNFSLEQLWNHCLAVCGFAKRIATHECMPKSIIEDACLAGLVHDLGVLVFATSLPEEFSKARELELNGEIDPNVAEREIFGATHAEVGAYMLGLWGIPETVVAAVAFHHVPTLYPHQEMQPLTVVHVSDACAVDTSPRGGVFSCGPLDHQYINNLGYAERLPEWQSLCGDSMEE